MNRFVGAIGLGRALGDEEHEQIRQVTAQLCLDPLYQDDTTLLFGCSAACLSVAGYGVVLGQLYRQNGHERVRVLSAAEQREIGGTRGEILVRDYWGHWVALLARRDRCDFVRAPFGSLPLCLSKQRDVLYFASDIALLAACGCDTRQIDWSEMARHLAASDVRRGQTCLLGISELRGGNRLAVGAKLLGTDLLWTPWPAARRAQRPGSFADTSDGLRSTILATVAAQVAAVRRPLLLLSGGLDSSILACALSAAGSDFSALTFVTNEPSGDERDYARLVANSSGIELIEAERQLSQVDVTRSDAAGLPRPARRSFMQDSTLLTKTAATSLGADRIIEGGGGDNVFCYLQSVTPVADRIRSGASWRDVIASARCIAELTESTLLTILRRALYRAWLRRDPLRSPLDLSLLTSGAAITARDAARHPWLAPPPGAWPGSVAHVALLVAAQSWVESFDPGARLPTDCPLLAQPIVEACLAVPSWYWFRHGQNRVVAREAFRGQLPDAIIDRRTKATPDSFVTQLYERNRKVLTDMLLDGMLVGNGIVDRVALAAVLRQAGPVRSQDHRRIMRIADAEAWARARTAAA